MPDHNNLRSAQLAPSARLNPQSELLPAAPIFPATQMPSLPSAFLPVSVQQPVVLPENRPKFIPIHQYPCDTLPLYNPNDHPYPQSPTKAANGQGGVQNEHGERLNHVQRGESSSTARAGPQQPTPQPTPAINTVLVIKEYESVAQLTTQWERTERSLLAQISYVALHGIIANEGQQTQDLEQVISWINDFVLGAKNRFHEIRALVSGLCAAVNNQNGNAPASAINPCAPSIQHMENLRLLLFERLIMGLLKILVPLFTVHKDMDTTEALLMLRIEGCKRGWIPFLTVLRLGKDGAAGEYLRTCALNRGLWKFWSLVVTGNRWAIDAIADARSIANGLSTSSIKVYLMPMGWDGKGWEGLMSEVINQKLPWFPERGVDWMIWEMEALMRLLSPAWNQSNHNHSNNHPPPWSHPPPWLNSYQMYASPPGPLPNGYKPTPSPANVYGGSSGCGCGCGAKYGCGRASGSGSRKRPRGKEDAYAPPQGSPLNPNRCKPSPAPPDRYDSPSENGSGRRKRQRTESDKRRVLKIRRLEAEKKQRRDQGPLPNV